MVEKKRYIALQSLEVYQLARELSKLAWEVYEKLDWQTKKTVGDQFITATDSVGANIAEGYGRFHYLDKIKFYFNARASLVESNEHWFSLLCERKKIASQTIPQQLRMIAERLSIKLQNFITVTYRAKKQ